MCSGMEFKGKATNVDAQLFINSKLPARAKIAGPHSPTRQRSLRCVCDVL